MRPFRDAAYPRQLQKIRSGICVDFRIPQTPQASFSSNLRLLWPAPGTGGYPHDLCAAFPCSPKKSVMPLPCCLEPSQLFVRRIYSRRASAAISRIALIRRCGALRFVFPIHHLSLLQLQPEKHFRCAWWRGAGSIPRIELRGGPLFPPACSQAAPAFPQWRGAPTPLRNSAQLYGTTSLNTGR